MPNAYRLLAMSAAGDVFFGVIDRKIYVLEARRSAQTTEVTSSDVEHAILRDAFERVDQDFPSTVELK
ncbi:MAG TPA: hypothetical protein VED59_02310 [Acidimicrobiales bacterium]|nr:hypothetical protein [Acidimicrobiales bacterium]